MVLPPRDEGASLINPIEAVNEDSALWSVPTPKMARRGGSFRRSCSLGNSSVLLHQGTISQDIDPPLVRRQTPENLGGEGTCEFCGEAVCNLEPILRVVVELSPDKPQGVVVIRKGDDVKEVAEKFIRENNLPEELSGRDLVRSDSRDRSTVPLAEKIYKDLADIAPRELSPIRTDVAVDDKIDFDLRDVEHRLSPIVHVPSPGEVTPPAGAAPRRRTPKSAATGFLATVSYGDKRRRCNYGEHVWSGVRNRGRGGRRGGLGGGFQKIPERESKKTERRPVEGPSVFSKLHGHAELRKQKLMRQRQELQQANMETPGSARLPTSRWQR